MQLFKNTESDMLVVIKMIDYENGILVVTGFHISLIPSVKNLSGISEPHVQPKRAS